MDSRLNDRDTAKPKDTVVHPDTVADTAALRVTVAAVLDLAASRLHPPALLPAQILSECPKRSQRCVSPAYIHLWHSVRRLWSWFSTVDTDRSGHISVHELREHPSPLARGTSS